MLTKAGITLALYHSDAHKLTLIIINFFSYKSILNTRFGNSGSQTAVSGTT